MAENIKHINDYAEKLAFIPEGEILPYDVIFAFACGAEWMLKRAEKRRQKDNLKLRRIITDLKKENMALKQELGITIPKRVKKPKIRRLSGNFV
jgi:hypothetical protein